MTTVQAPDGGRLYGNVRDAIASLPLYFRTETHIAGVIARRRRSPNRRRERLDFDVLTNR